MKTTNKKRKRKGSRKSTRSRDESKAPLKADSGLNLKKEDTKTKITQVAPRKVVEKRSADKAAVSGYINIAVQFLRESKMELKKVKWPTRKELLASTSMVIIFVLVLAFYLGLIDLGLIKIIKRIVG